EHGYPLFRGDIGAALTVDPRKRPESCCGCSRQCAPRGSMGAQNVRHLHGLSCLATAAAQGPQTARQELLSGYRTLRPGLPIGSDFVPWHTFSVRGAAAIWSAFWGSSAVATRLAAWLFMTTPDIARDWTSGCIRAVVLGRDKHRFNGSGLNHRPEADCAPPIVKFEAGIARRNEAYFRAGRQNQK